MPVFGDDNDGDDPDEGPSDQQPPGYPASVGSTGSRKRAAFSHPTIAEEHLDSDSDDDQSLTSRK